MADPLVSLILCVKNGMPYLPKAIESVVAQTFRSFELIVQDAKSNDGSLEWLHSVEGLPHVDIVSEPDGGIGDAYNRAVRRCQGEIVGSIDSDNLLEPDALERVVLFFEQRPQLAAAYGGANMIGAEGDVLHPWLPDEFDLMRLLMCELVPPFATSFYSLRACGSELRFDESLKTCADFDLWLRISHLPIERMPDILGSTRLSSKSMTRDGARYEEFVGDKLTAVRKYLDGFEHNTLRDAVERRSRAGILLWAAESLYELECPSPRFAALLREAEQLDPGSPRLAVLVRNSEQLPEDDADEAPEDDAREPEQTQCARRLWAGRSSDA